MEKAVSLVLVFAMSMMVCVPAFAVEKKSGAKIDSSVNENSCSKIYKRSQLNSLSKNSPQDIGESKVVDGKSQTKVVSGYAGNQASNGYTFPTGGGFYFSDEGGPSVTASFSFGDPWGVFRTSVNLGKAGSSGKIITVPDKTHSYKLYVEKTIKVTPYIAYYRVTSAEPWSVVQTGEYVKVTHVTAYAVRVD